MRISFIKGNAMNTRAEKVFDGSFEEFAKTFKTYRPGKGKHQDYWVRGEITERTLSAKDKKDNPDKKPYLRRSNEGMLTASLLVLDGDQSTNNPNSAPDPKPLHNLLKIHKINHFIHTTHSYAPPDKIKWRCYIPCEMGDKDQLKPTLDKIFALLKQADYPLVSVKENWTWSQPWFLPNRESDDGKYIFLEYHKGNVYQPAASSAQPQTATSTSESSTHKDNLDAIREGVSYYKELQNVIYGFAKDGRTREAANGDIEMIMLASKAASPNFPEHDKWVNRFKELPVYIDQAFNSVTVHDVVTEVKQEDKKAKAPDFPSDIMDDWPQPWPMIWDNFKKIPLEVVEPLLVPTVLSTNAYFLDANYLTGQGRRPNFFFLNLAPSTAKKDVNSKNVIRDLDKILKSKGAMVTAFSGILNTESTITADTTFLNSFDDGNLFWINTEATRIFQQLKNSSMNSSVAALSDKFIEVVDGHEITGKNKASGKVSTIEDPNCQVLLYAQPETIENYITEEMIDSGLFGRALVTIQETMSDDYDSMFSFAECDHSDIDEEFIEFYTPKKADGLPLKKRIKFDSKQKKILNAWFVDSIKPMIKCETTSKLLTRIAITVEQLYSVVLGICQKYDVEVQGMEKPRSKIDVTCILPLAEYWAKSKMFAVNNYVNKELDPIYTEIIEVVQQFLTGEISPGPTGARKAIKEHSVVPVSQLSKAIGQRAKLIRKLSADGNQKDALEKVRRAVKGMLEMEILVEKKVGKMWCVGISSGY